MQVKQSGIAEDADTNGKQKMQERFASLSYSNLEKGIGVLGYPWHLLADVAQTCRRTASICSCLTVPKPALSPLKQTNHSLDVFL